jgi:hypothetical protein
VDGLDGRVLAELRDLMGEHDVYRGQVLTIAVDPLEGSRIEFVERPALARDELVLPDGLLESIELHAVGVSRHRDVLVAAGRHLSRGLLLWGPPGTGKTHTVRYLIGARPDRPPGSPVRTRGCTADSRSSRAERPSPESGTRTRKSLGHAEARDPWERPPSGRRVPGHEPRR